MRLAIISDIHANLEALQAVLEDIRQQQADRIVCLGDVVGYGADPAACVALVRERAGVCVLGNHDAAVFNEHQRSYFNPFAIEAVRWTVRQLSAEDVAFLRGLPFRVSSDNLLFVHSAPRAPEEWEYVFSGMEARMQSKHFFERVCFVGHSHIPGVYPLDGGGAEYDPLRRYLVNVGSVGQPRDRDWRSCYGLLDTVAGSFTHRRVAYDVETAVRKILDSGLPQRLAERLRDGV